MNARRFSLRVPWWSVVAALVVARASPAQAATRTVSCPTPRIDTATATATRWAPPLDRLITLRAADLSLRDALDRVAATAHLRMSYSAELLPLDRAVCLAADATPVGRVLVQLLSGSNVSAVGVGGDQVVLAPRREQPAAASHGDPDMAPSTGVLDRVVVTGSATGGASLERELTVGLNVIDGRQLARDNTSSIADALDSYVPGIWGWAQAPSTMMSSYASIRGASSFGLSYPKVYIDGIEVANPLLLSRFNPGSIERIEVIRGPQGSALYGTDAISGVVNIVTRHDGAPADGTHMLVRSTAGVSQSSYAGNVLAQDHSMSFATGTSARSADFNLALGSIGSYVPNGYSSDLMATGSARIVGALSSLSTTARLFVQRAGTPNSPLVVRPRLPGDTTPVQAVSEYTLGATGTTMVDDQWTMSLVAGVDGYRLDHVQTNFTPIPSTLDSALKAAEGGADRGTIRASSVYQVNAGQPTHATITISGEHATMRLSTVPQPQAQTTHSAIGGANPMRYRRSLQPEQPASGQREISWQNSTGIVGQANVAIADRFFATGGVRFEHDSRLAGVDQVETMPMLGLATVGDVGPFTVKLRSAYGEGIRPPTTPSRLQFWPTQSGFVAQEALGPERQSGIETGIDILVKRAFSFQATRFNQRASGLIQPVAVPADTTNNPYRMIYIAQNVGVITNRGWEFQATGSVSRLTVTGTLSLVDSRVDKLASGYRGDLATGDRMLQVPARTESINLAWTEPRWHFTLGGSRALDWVNYDELRLTQAFASNLHPARDLTGQKLRAYWKQYDGGLRLRAAASRDLRDMFAVEISAENLLNHQTGEPDNVTIIPGRTLMTGLKVKF